ncbi:carbamate kinase [Staphylococcus haemolyticus]|uniref:Carbamate kinase n=5 Tax=Bacillales TaxID=1385 RepID=ARCC_STAHJ|nr:carbamate kinase [Staphylococcus haemolyticus]Q4L9V7.2 RecName: Full=Carbamate kinase [Staphylococcus haemolyticus JCSC1435]MDU2096908.1 carbamate kinase [Staphylococcus sp.]GEU19877.1 carbamate kinase 2 [Bacillus anthracis]AKC75061.1 carbamate kinase, ArcC1 [Staphylococcus haemolyticus]MBF2215052.1 carbamate kinase [Staphylococcus haemolyticus]MBF2217142.1 carbamate kinase [Staphylococcus haemolyticus]
MSKIVVALGGNALGQSPEEQLELVKGTAKSLVSLIQKGYEVVISHGNGPQVGSINLGLNYAAENGQGPAFPFPECGAMSQAYIGYQLQESLLNELHVLNIDKQVVTLVTQVEVAGDDQAFNNPTKPIGLFYTKEQAEQTMEEKGYKFVEDSGRGYRRVVPSPMPINIVELDSIETLIKHGTLVIAAGGGGIPVVKEEGNYKGVDAVIDKDKTSALLAAHLKSDQLIILTAVDYVYINYGKDNQEALGEVTVDEMNQHIADGQFAKGSMLPKVEAALQFIEKNPEGSVLITSLEDLGDALDGKIGTLIKK